MVGCTFWCFEASIARHSLPQNLDPILVDAFDVGSSDPCSNVGRDTNLSWLKHYAVECACIDILRGQKSVDIIWRVRFLSYDITSM